MTLITLRRLPVVAVTDVASGDGYHGVVTTLHEAPLCRRIVINCSHPVSPPIDWTAPCYPLPAANAVVVSGKSGANGPINRAGS